MRIDPLTLVAQLVNFGLLVVLLWRLLFRPVAGALRDREARIRNDVQAAERSREEAEREREAARREREELESERDRRRQGLADEIDRERSELLETARAEAEREHAKQLARLAEERQQASAHLRREAGRLMAEAVARGLASLAGRTLEDAVLARFAERISELGEAERSALRARSTRWTLATARPLDAAVRRELLETLRGELGGEAAVDVIVEPELVAGLELRAGDHSLGWSIRDLADDLARRFEAQPEEGTVGPEPKVRPAERGRLEEAG